MPEQQAVYSVRTGAADHLPVPTTVEAEVAALLREREGYTRRGLADRAAQVGEQLRLRGWGPPAEQPAPAKAKPAAKPRSRRPAAGRS